MSLSVTVTGATGFLGNNLVRQLLAQGDQVTVIVRPGFDRRVFDGIHPTIIEGQLDDPATLERALANADAIVHAAAYIVIGKTQLEESRQVNVELTRAIANAANNRKIRMIYVSTVDALAASKKRHRSLDETDVNTPKSQSSYTISKREAEVAVLDLVKCGLDGVIINPGFMLGPWDWKPSSGRMIQAIANTWLPMAPGGGASVVHVRDVCRGIISAIKLGVPGERYVLAGHNVTYLELWRMFSLKAGKKWPRWKMRRVAAFAVGKYGDLKTLLGHETEVNSEAVKVGQLFSYFSSAKAERELDYQISPLESAVDDAYRWLKEHGYL